ncbi:hypothetical protein [Neisseria sp. Ec49-e6-T10]|uniref:hypothetical protein n=1 Tax=Neisseria sp. Ec49-e6-T10 TaxID=3140744 RepID=UPI003EBB78A8
MTIALGLSLLVGIASGITLLLNNSFNKPTDPYSFLDPVEPISVPFEVYKKGHKISTSFWVVPRAIDKNKSYHEVSLKMTYKKDDDPNTPRYFDQQHPKENLIRIKIFRVTNDANETLVTDHIVTNLNLNAGWSLPEEPNERYEDCILTTFKTEYGFFRLEAEVLQNIPELNTDKIQYSLDVKKYNSGK